METTSALRESRWTKLGSKIAVRNVQALAASDDQQTAETLERYIRPDIDRDAVLVEHSSEVPVIDLGKLLNRETGEEEAAVLKFACEEWGFFQLVKHGIPEEIIVNIKRDLQKFFELPLHAKNAYAQSPGEVQGYGQAFVMSDDQKLDCADLLGVFSQPPQARDMRYWPTEPQTFRSSLEDFSSELMKVAHSVVTSIAKTLNIDIETMGDKYLVQFLRMNYYPPCTSMPEKVLGFSPHSDASFLTLLLEVNPVQGLQIRRHGAWIPVKPRADALLVNVGDFPEFFQLRASGF
ncbi:hypothetical protein E2562_006517 [Oryza meyeriana var. granulata]|uniref:Fe2OG dioxygenase domain-containing protein n=1 Tax=Oryza meyeriana var. granulata TaxID=110450 RepID=A0A6G1BSS6_9ORYZ|nr:hypothetical protein E2562_006517 [Oryza meyeriana var. granulata]KAF0891158.1 hypothetical protein E2562_006517 [Oryza meyeriana var. granulata]